MTDIVTLAKELVEAEAVVTSDAFAERNERIAVLSADLEAAEAARAAELARFDKAVLAAIAVGDDEAFDRGVEAARAEAAAAAAEAAEAEAARAEAAPSPAPTSEEVAAMAIDRLEYLALARAENATDRNDAKSAATAARAEAAAAAAEAAEAEAAAEAALVEKLYAAEPEVTEEVECEVTTVEYLPEVTSDETPSSDL